MSNDKQTAVDSIIEFCHKQMETDSSIHKGVYLSIIKFCQEQITEPSEKHWKSTVFTSANTTDTTFLCTQFVGESRGSTSNPKCMKCGKEIWQHVMVTNTI